MPSKIMGRRVARGRAGALAAALAFMVAVGGASGEAVAQGRASGVLVEEVVSIEVTETAPIIGQFVASVEAAVAARSSGVVDAVMVQAGDLVAAGDVILRLDPTLPEIAKRQAIASLRRAEAGVAQAEARLALARQALARSESLQGSTAFSRGSFEDQQLAVTEAESGLASAQAEQVGAEVAVARADYDLDNAVIVAPFDGAVIERMAQPGEYIAVGAPAARLLDLGGLEIEIAAPAELVPGLRPGVTVTAAVDIGAEERRLEATVRAVIPREAVATRTRPVRLSIAPEDKRAVDAAPGRSVTVFAPTSAPRIALTAPKDALVQGRGGWMVYVAVEGADGAPATAEPRPVRIGAAFGGRVEILSGVAEGELVVTRGNERLQPGQPIAPSRAEDAKKNGGSDQG